ncbi:MAG TPA: nuclear transport factor 2 family protein [Burkholderiales bacterium]|nr:nuclear transport factor 2 family protein [Burkholderiales bacterium]
MSAQLVVPALTPAFAQRFAAEWIDAWNAHDLERVLSHYEDEFEMSSPLITRLAGEPSGKLRGKAAVSAYWSLALKLIPWLRLELAYVLSGVDSVVIHYRGHRGLVAEVLRFSPSGKVIAAAAHYL